MVSVDGVHPNLVNVDCLGREFTVNDPVLVVLHRRADGVVRNRVVYVTVNEPRKLVDGRYTERVEVEVRHASYLTGIQTLVELTVDSRAVLLLSGPPAVVVGENHRVSRRVVQVGDVVVPAVVETLADDVVLPGGRCPCMAELLGVVDYRRTNGTVVVQEITPHGTNAGKIDAGYRHPGGRMPLVRPSELYILPGL